MKSAVAQSTSQSRLVLLLPAEWDVISPTREYLLALYTQRLADEPAASELALAAHELLENAVKYSVEDAGPIRLAVTSAGPADRSGIPPAGPFVEIAVENDAEPEHAALLSAELRALAAAADPCAYYRDKMTESSARTDGKSGLGLARIRCETAFALSGEMAPEESSQSSRRVCVLARRSLVCGQPDARKPEEMG